MTDLKLAPLNLLALPPLQRRVMVHLTREGPANVTTLALALNQDPTELRHTLDELVTLGTIHLSEDGQVEINLGRTRRRALPGRLWPALLAANRLYSTQEIATLRAVIPILQFARAKLSEFADHGPGHALRVKSFATQLGYLLGLTSTEHHLLRAGALFHDVGNIVERGRHHLISQETVESLTAAGSLPFSATEAALVGLLCRWHRKEYDPNRCDDLRGQSIRTGLLASILRVADAMDIDHRRSDYTDRFALVLRHFFPGELPYWTSLEEILGLRIHCGPTISLQIFRRDQLTDNLQVAMLRKDLETTPLAWSLREIAVKNKPTQTTEPGLTQKGLALLVFPFDPHSIVMAALSRKHLQLAGHRVELLCYPDTADSPAWLWHEALNEFTPGSYEHLVVINDRPDPGINADLLKLTGVWRTAGVNVSLLNRHEANWDRLPALIEQGVEVILGGDWAYFWGEPTSQADLAWGRIAALCTRDPTQSTVGLTVEEQSVSQGLLKTVYDAARQPTASVGDWAALAEAIMDRIVDPDPTRSQTFFAAEASDFGRLYATLPEPGRVDGRVLRFEQVPAEFPPAYYWALEAAIEHEGRSWERGICFNTPYAIATWSTGEAVELLAINHWRDERAIPIWLLYPTDLGPPPTGNESVVQVRLSPAQAEALVQALVDACNQTDL